MAQTRSESQGGGASKRRTEYRLSEDVELFSVPASDAVSAATSATNSEPKIYKETWDIFISHATEDKDEIARPLAENLRMRGLKVWYDEYTLRVGDSLRKCINEGLAGSDFGVVILSPNFFKKHWPEQELNGLATKELHGEKVILPVWHNVNHNDVSVFSPILADRIGVSTTLGLEHVVSELIKAMV